MIEEVERNQTEILKSEKGGLIQGRRRVA